MILPTFFALLRLNGAVAPPAGADAKSIPHIIAENFAIAYLAGVCRLLYRFSGLVLPILGGDQDLKLDFREHLSLHLLMAPDIRLHVPLDAAHDLAACDSTHINLSQSIQNRVQFFFSDDCFQLDNRIFFLPPVA